MRRALLVALVLAGCASPAPAATGPEPLPPLAERAFGDARTIGEAPERFHVEGVAYRGGRVFAGSAVGATGDPLPLNNLGVPSRVFVWDRASGALLDTILVDGEETERSHGLTGLTFDGAGRLYGLSTQLGLLRWTEGPTGWTQERLVALPDLPPCTLGGSPCSPTLRDDPPLGNDLTWGPDGALYVSDSFQATIWRIDGTGSVAPWWQSELLDRRFGANGLRVHPDGASLVVAVTGPDSATVGPVSRASSVLSVAFPDPSVRSFRVLMQLPNGDLADGLAYGEAGALYVLSNAGHRIFVQPEEGAEPTVLDNRDLDGAQMTFPASLAFTGDGALVLTNYAYFEGAADASTRSVIDVHVADRGHPVVAPTVWMEG